MSIANLVMSSMAMLGGLAVGMCALSRSKRFAADSSQPARVCFSFLSMVPAMGGFFGIAWCFMGPPFGSPEISGPPAHHRNDPSRSVYFGNGCFWHTQYDLVVLEQEVAGVFKNRSDRDVTSLVGYAGGRYQSASGTACYHGLPWTDYSKLGHAEVVSITLDAISGPIAQAQISALAKLYFEHGFATVEEGRQRLDPQDTGAEYRNAIGLPGGMDNSELWPLIAAANTFAMPLVRGTGGNQDDTEDEYVVYVYDSLQYVFFRGEASHQFHPNTVVQRAVPSSYTNDLKQVQADMGRLDSTGCADVPGEVALLIVFCFALLIGLGFAVLCGVLPVGLRFWNRLYKSSVDDDARQPV